MKNTQNKIKKDHLRMSNQESKELTRESIQTALLQLMKETAFEQITVTAVIKRAGVSRAGFYRNYVSKEAVLQDVAAYFYKNLYESYLQKIDKSKSYDHYRMLLQYIQEHEEWFGILTSLDEHTHNIFSVDPYIKQYFFSQSSEEYYLYIAIIHSQKAIIVDWFKNGMQESPEEMARILEKFYKNSPIL